MIISQETSDSPIVMSDFGPARELQGIVQAAAGPASIVESYPTLFWIPPEALLAARRSMADVITDSEHIWFPLANLDTKSPGSFSDITAGEMRRRHRPG